MPNSDEIFNQFKNILGFSLCLHLQKRSKFKHLHNQQLVSCHILAFSPLWVWFCPSQVYTVDKKLEHRRASLKLRSNKGLSWEAGSSQRQKGRDFAESTNNNLLYCSTICPITCGKISAKQKLPNSWCLLQFLQGGKHLKSFEGRRKMQLL